MQKKSNNVQHFKLKPSKAWHRFKNLLYVLATALIIFCSLDWFFKVLLLLLISLEYIRQHVISYASNNIEAIEIRGDKVFLKRENDEQFQPITQVNIKQNRIFAELELHLKDEVRSEFIYRDSFDSPPQFSLLMQNLRLSHL